MAKTKEGISPATKVKKIKLKRLSREELAEMGIVRKPMFVQTGVAKRGRKPKKK